MSETCRFTKGNGERCQAAALTDSEFCFWHDPAMAGEREQAQRLGGLRRRREKATSQVYDWNGLDSACQIKRVLEIAMSDTLGLDNSPARSRTLGLDNSPARSRTLGYLASLSLKALEIGELEQRVSALEAMVVGKGGASRRVRKAR